jgi:hypothetical protein
MSIGRISEIDMPKDMEENCDDDEEESSPDSGGGEIFCFWSL